MSNSTSTTDLADGKLRLDHPAEHVARLTIVNARKRNALDHAILDAIAATVPTLEARCLIVTGEGPVFSAGYDIGSLDSDDFATAAEALVAHPFHAAIEALEAFPYPAVAALNGHAIGGGLELALSCDLIVASEDAVVGMPPAKLGLIYSHTGLRKFVDAVGLTRTRQLFHTAKNISTRRAETWGLVNEVVAEDDLAARGVELAKEIAALAPLALAGNKRILRELVRAEVELDADVEQELIALRESCFASADFLEGVRSFAREAPARMEGSLRAPGAVRGGIARDAKSVLFGGARRRRLLIAFVTAAAVLAVAATYVFVRPALADDAWPVSTAAGTPSNGHLVHGVQLPDEGFDFFTWDPVLNGTPNRGSRRWGTDRLLRTVYDVLADYRAADPLAPRVGIMDLSRRHGGFFGAEYGGLGHASHQNGLDIDVLYPRTDGRERRAFRPDQVDQVRSQKLVDLFVAAGAQFIFVGPHLHLTGPKRVVQPLVYHDDHLHVRIR